MKNLSLLLFLVCVVGTGWAIGYLNIPGEWYAGLVKPGFNPPGCIFGPVWTLLYVLIAVAGWRTWNRQGFGSPFFLWLMQMGLNFAWSPVFFGMHKLEIAFGVILLLLFVILVFLLERWRHDRTTALLFMPYALWVAFASVLNYSLMVLN